MKILTRCAFLPAAVAVFLAPALAFAGPDPTPAPHPHHKKGAIPTLRSEPPPPVVVRQTTSEERITETPQEDIIQPLRQREESANYRFAYRALTSLGLAGSEADDKPVGYNEIYGPTSIRTYHRPGPPPPRKFKFETEPVEEKPAATPAPEATPSAAPSPLPEAGTTNNPATSANPANAPGSPTPDASQDPSVLPDPSLQAGQSRNDEILSYFQRPRPTRQIPANANGNYPNGPAPYPYYGDPTYLQMPEQLPLPQSRATYRVVPK